VLRYACALDNNESRESNRRVLRRSSITQTTSTFHLRSGILEFSIRTGERVAVCVRDTSSERRVASYDLDGNREKLAVEYGLRHPTQFFSRGITIAYPENTNEADRVNDGVLNITPRDRCV